MGVYQPAAFRYLVGVCATAAAVVAAILLKAGLPSVPEWISFGLLTAMAAVSHLYPVRSARETSFYVLATVFLFAAILVLPVWLLALHTLLVMLPFTLLHWYRGRPRVWYRWAFNTAQTALAALATHQYLNLAGWGDGFNGPASLVLVMGAVVLLPVLQGLLVATMIHLNNGVRLLEAGPLQREPLLTELVMAMLGAVVAALWYAQPWFLLLMPVPLVIVQSLMRRVQMIHLADLDAKTGLYNYRYFEQAMNQEFAMARRVRRPTTLMFMDLDYLRHVNNEYGHLAGDYVIKEVAGVLTRALRPGDLLARFGGEEFVAMLPGTELAEAWYVAERMRHAVAEHDCRFDGQTIRVTISIGLVAYPVDGQEPAELLRRADEVLYQAKAGGRNRVCVACDSFPGGAYSPVDGAASMAGRIAAEAVAQVAAAAFPVRLAPEARRPEEAPDRPAPTSPSAQTAAQADPPSLYPSWFENAVPAGVAVIGCLVALWTVLRLPWPYPATGTLGVLLVLGVASEFWRVQVYDGGRQGITISMSSGAIMAAVALLDPAGAMLVGLAACAANALHNQNRTMEKTLFNIGTICLSTAAAALVYGWTAPPPQAALAWSHAISPLLAALSFHLVNMGLVHLAVSLRTRQALPALLRENLWFAPALMLSGLTGAFLGATYALLGPVGVTIFLAPVLVLRYSFTLYANRARKAIRALEQAKEAVEASQSEKERTMDQLIVTISAIIDARDRSVSGHSRQVARYAVVLAEELGLPAPLQQRIRIAALLHDLGKIGVPEAILHKPGRLTAEEYALVKNHAPLGAQILSEVAALQDVARMVGEHHEYWSGAGYPFGKSGEAISIGGRVLAVADALDTILSDRPYSRARPLAWAVDEIRRCSGTQFDPQVVDALLRVVARQDRNFFVNSTRPGEEHMRTLFAVGGRTSGD